MDEFLDDKWYQASLNLKGDLGFAELSATASYFDRHIKYQYDNSNYDQWRTAYYGVYLGYDLYNTNYLIGPLHNDQTQDRWSYEVRLTSQGESRFQWMAGAFYEDVYDWWHYGSRIPGLETTTHWEYAQYLADYYNGLGYDVQYPLNPTDDYYTDTYDRTVKQKAIFGELTFDLTEQWSVTGGARWFEYDREGFERRQSPVGSPDTRRRPRGQGQPGDLREGLGHGVQVLDAVSLRRSAHDLCALQRGLSPGRQQQRPRRGKRHPAPRVQAGHAAELRGRLQDPMAG